MRLRKMFGDNLFKELNFQSIGYIKMFGYTSYRNKNGNYLRKYINSNIHPNEYKYFL